MPTRIFPRRSSRRIFPLPSSDRIFPVVPAETHFVQPGASKYVLLGERVYPFGELEVVPPSGVTISAIDYKLTTDVSWTSVSLGSNPDLLTAARFISVVVSAFSSTRSYDIRITFSDGATRTQTVDVNSTVRLARNKTAVSTHSLRVFGDATFATDASLIDTIKYEVSGASTVAKTDIPRETIITGTHDGAGNSASLIDTTTNFVDVGVRVGDITDNDTDSSSMTVTAISTTTNTNDTLAGTLSGGTDNDWDASDAYTVKDGDDKILIASNFQLALTGAGVHKVTLYVKDTGANEESASTFVRVST